MRTRSHRRVPPPFRPHVLSLEARLPLGDGLLGLFTAAALLPGHATPAAQRTPQPAGEPGVSTPGSAAPIRGFTPPARPGDALVSAFAEEAPVTLTAPAWQPLTDLFAPSPRPSAQRGLLDAAESRPALLPAEPAPVAAVAFTIASPAPVTAGHDADGALLAVLGGMRVSDPPAPGQVTSAQQAQVKDSFGKLPLYFEQNVGQTDAQVHFFARGPGYGLYLTSTEAVMVLSKPTDNNSARRAGGVNPRMEFDPGVDTPGSPVDDAPPAVVRMQLVGANATPAVTGRDGQPGKVNYFLGNDPAQWHTNIATFGRVQYDDVYPGIDLVWYGTNRQLEYDFVVAAGADPSTIYLNVSGAERMEVDAAGDLVVTAGGQELRQHKPLVYQTVGSTQQEVASRFVLEGQQVRFAQGAYDTGRPLVIDPVLSYSTYLGGSRTDFGYGVAVDPTTGDTLIAGGTTSLDFPTSNALQPAYGGGTNDVFVARLRANGSALVYATYLGGSGSDYSDAIAVDPFTGDALLTGPTASFNFPTVSPLQLANRGRTDAFVTRLRADGAALVYSTYVGGDHIEEGVGIAVDPATGDALFTGFTQSANFPTANALQPAISGPLCQVFPPVYCPDAFVARLRRDGQALLYSTYLGGRWDDVGLGIAVDPATGEALLTGRTASFNFPIANAFRPYFSGGSFDAYVARLRADGSALVYSTFLGGSLADEGHGVAVDPATGDALLTGMTHSTDFPTANPFQPAHQGEQDVYVTRLSADGQALVYSTYLGGSNHDLGFGIAVDPATGDALLTGETQSTDFPTANPLQAANRGDYDAFVARLNAVGSSLLFSTYLGGSGYDQGSILAADPATGDVLVGGLTASTNFPTADPLQPTHGGGDYDAFVTKIGAPPAAYYYVYPDSGQVQAGVPIDFYVFALDAQFNVIPDYTGLVLFYATDPLATTPVYHYFQRPNPGYASFAGGLTFNTPGVQELYVFDWPGVQVFGYAAFEVRP